MFISVPIPTISASGVPWDGEDPGAELKMLGGSKTECESGMSPSSISPKIRISHFSLTNVTHVIWPYQKATPPFFFPHIKVVRSKSPILAKTNVQDLYRGTILDNPKQEIMQATIDSGIDK